MTPPQPAPPSEDRVAELDARIAVLEQELAGLGAELAEARVERDREARQRAQAEATLETLRRQPIVRAGLATKQAMRDLRPAIIQTAKVVSRPPRRFARNTLRSIRAWRLRASPRDEARFLERLRADLPPSPVTSGPLVSIIVLNRDGEAHLRRCLPALARTAYRDLELILVDNASRDGSVAAVEAFEAPFPVRVLRNAVNRSFGEANDQALEAAQGDLILLLNNDIEPIESDWLGHLVETLSARDAVAVGARLIYPSHRGVKRAGSGIADLALQHRGIEFDRSIAGVPYPRVIGAGENPRAPAAAAVTEVPAVTAACLLARREAIEAVGGFGGGYHYGLEDVDLCLRLRAAGGRIVYDGRAALWHHESATRQNDPEDIRLERHRNNRREFIDRWGPRLTREVLRDAIDGTAAWSTAPLHVGIAITRNDERAGYGDWYSGHELGEALAGLGWRVSYLERYRDRWYDPPEDLDVVVSLIDAFDLRRLPRRIVSVAWPRNWPDRWASRPWYDDYDLVCASSAGLAEILEARRSKPTHRLPIAANTARFRPQPPDPDLTCDVLFAGNHWGEERGVVQALPALAAAGLTVHVYGRGWETLPAIAPLHRGSLPYERLPAAYASAAVVIDDTASPTKPYGAVNTRVFDALAAGAVVVTDNPAGAAELGLDLPSWSDADSLVETVRGLLADREAAQARVATAQAHVRGEHTYARRAETLRRLLGEWVGARRIGIRIGAPSWDVAESWGDLHFARGLQKAFERAGHPTRVHVLEDWDAESAARDDATLHLFGLKTPRQRSGQVNLLWQISHPDLGTAELFDGYDAAFVASDAFADRMAGLSTTPVLALHQATDPERFSPRPGGPAHELLFVANARSSRRKIVDDLRGTRHDLAVYGRGWTPALVNMRHVRGEQVPNEDLAAYYSTAAIVLNDHWPDMRAWGFMSNRLYDALACGACVVSDDVPGLEAEFDGAVTVYRSPAELNAAIDALLADPSRRAALGTRGRAAVLARHTLAHRAATILDVLRPLLRARPEGVSPD